MENPAKAHHLPYAVRLRRWNAYVLAVAVPLLIVLTALSNNIVARNGNGAPAPILPQAVDVLTSAAGIGVVAISTWGAAIVFMALRNPPRIHAPGLVLWLYRTMPEPLFVPWEQVAEVSVVRGGLRVYVHAPESLALGDEARVRRIRRATRKTGGAIVSMPIDTSPGRLEELDAAIRFFSAGRHALRHR
jgi:hypothetical protein